MSGEFTSRPKIKRSVLWLMLTLKDGSTIEAIVDNDLLAFGNNICEGVVEYVPRGSTSTKKQLIGVELLENIQVLGTVGNVRNKRHASKQGVHV